VIGHVNACIVPHGKRFDGARAYARSAAATSTQRFVRSRLTGKIASSMSNPPPTGFGSSAAPTSTADVVLVVDDEEDIRRLVSFNLD
jgi:hypothetical protein